MSRKLLFAPLLLVTGLSLAADAPADKHKSNDKKPAPAPAATAETKANPEEKKPEAESTEAKAKTEESGNLGMSILGNQEAPKALVIVPWKTSELGKSMGISTLLDDSRQPIDKEVFLRVLSYYELIPTTTHPSGAPAGGPRTTAAESDATQPGTAPPRRK